MKIETGQELELELGHLGTLRVAVTELGASAVLTMSRGHQVTFCNKAKRLSFVADRLEIVRMVEAPPAPAADRETVMRRARMLSECPVNSPGVGRHLAQRHGLAVVVLDETGDWRAVFRDRIGDGNSRERAADQARSWGVRHGVALRWR